MLIGWNFEYDHYMVEKCIALKEGKKKQPKHKALYLCVNCCIYL